MADFVSSTSDIGKFGYLKLSAQSMAAWLFLFSLNTFETEKVQVIAFATTDCLWSAECACLLNVLVFQFLHSLPDITLLFFCFTHNLQVIKWSYDSKWSRSYWSILFRPHLLKFTDCLLSFSLLRKGGEGIHFIWFLGLLVCCLVW